MPMGLGLGLGLGRGGAGVDPYSTASILAALAGTGASVYDPTTATLYQTTDTSTPVTASTDPVGRFVDSSSDRNLLQSTSGNRPLYDLTSDVKSLSFDGTNDRLQITSGGALDIFRNIAYATIIGAANITGGANTRPLVTITNNVTNQRAEVAKTTADKLRVGGRKLDADSFASVTSTASINGAWHVCTGRFDFANDLVSARIDLETAESGAVGWGAGSATSDTASGAIYFGSNSANFMLGKIGRVAIVPQNISAALEEQIIRWAGQGAALSFPFDLYDYYVDSSLGSDTNVGTQALPLKTIAALPSTSNVRIGLKRGSSWRESLAVSSGASVGAYGDPTDPMPVLDAADVAGTWSKTGGQTNVYDQSWSHEYSAGKSYLSLWEDGERLRWQSSIALCDSNPGSYYVATPSSTTTTVYVHPKSSTDPTSDGKIYEISKRLKGLQLGAGCQARNIRTKRPVHHDGSLTVGAGGRIDGCIGEDGCVHNIFLAEDAAAYDCIAWKADWADRNTVTMFIAFVSDGTGHTARFERCIAVNDPAKITTAMLGFYSHTGSNSTPWGSVQVVDCATYGVYDGTSFANCNALLVERLNAAATRIAIRSRISGQLSVIDPWVHPVAGSGVVVGGVFTQQDNTGYGVIEGVRVYTDDNTSGINQVANGGTGAIEVRNSVFVGDTVGGNLAAVGNTDNTTPLNVHHCVISGLERAYNALGTSAWESDYNNAYPSSIDVRYGGTTHGSFSAYRSAQPTRDLNSVTTDPGLADPANGDFSGTNIPAGMGLERPSISYTAIPTDEELAAM